MRKKILLIGNSVNLLGSAKGKTFDVLMKDLCKKYSTKYDINIIKPLPLLYEEIFQNTLRNNKKGINISEQIKKDFTESLNKMEHNDYHKEYMNLGFENVLTSNYDYNLENSVGGKFKRKNIVKETKFSLFRRAFINDTNLWHIHGEVQKPKSLVLGYESYISYISEIKKYVSFQTMTHKPATISPFKKEPFDMDFDVPKSNQGNKNKFSWVDLFFRDDVFIVGLTMDFSEIDLWWLISTKGYRKISKDSKRKNYGNTTVYYFVNNMENKKKNDLAKISLMKSFGVNVIELKIKSSDDYKRRHEEIISQLNKPLTIKL